jgi:hypothetical protein
VTELYSRQEIDVILKNSKKKKKNSLPLRKGNFFMQVKKKKKNIAVTFWRGHPLNMLQKKNHTGKKNNSGQAVFFFPLQNKMYTGKENFLGQQITFSHGEKNHTGKKNNSGQAVFFFFRYKIKFILVKKISWANK